MKRDSVITQGATLSRWLTHWLSALLVLFLLLTALPLAVLAGLRPPLRIWSALHMSAGWVLILVTVARVPALLGGDARKAMASPGLRAGVKIALLAALFVILAAGLVIYRPSPLQGPAFLFGVIAAAPLLTISHTLHLQLLSLHRYMSFGLAALLAAHVALAFIRRSPGDHRPIAWLWRPRR